MKFHWNFMKKKGPLNEITSLLLVVLCVPKAVKLHFMKNQEREKIAVMTRHGTLSRRPAKEQPPADIRDDKTTNTTADYTHIPLPSSAPSIPCPASDRCATAVPVGELRRSVPSISRFCPFLGW
jgi:hypothetical protein